MDENDLNSTLHHFVQFTCCIIKFPSMHLLVSTRKTTMAARVVFKSLFGFMLYCVLSLIVYCCVDYVKHLPEDSEDRMVSESKSGHTILEPPTTKMFLHVLFCLCTFVRGSQYRLRRCHSCQ